MQDRDSNLPPPSVLNALRQPRRTELNDPCVRELLRRWKRLGKSQVLLRDVREIADLVAPELGEKQMGKILEALEAAGFRFASEVRAGRGMSTAYWVSWKLRSMRDRQELLRKIKALPYRLTPSEIQSLQNVQSEMNEVVKAYLAKKAAKATEAKTVVAAAALPQKAEAESVSNWWDEAETEGFRKAWSRPPISLEPENPADLDRNVAES